MDKSQPTTAELAILISGAVMLIGSFISFYGSPGTWSAWSSFMFPVATLLPLYGVLMAAQIALTKFANVTLPEHVAGFTWEQIHLVLAFFSALLAICFLVAKNTSLSAGIFIELIAAAGLVYGAVMLQKERHTGALG